MGTGGYCEALTRTAVGAFVLDAAVGLDDLAPPRDLLSPLLGVAHLPRVVVAGEQVQRLRHGNRLRADAPVPPGEVALLDPAGKLLAIAETRDDQTLQPKRVFLTGT